MKVIICEDAAQVGAVAGAKVAQVCRRVGPGVAIGVATGSSPLETYADLAARVADGRLDLSRAYAFALDEYVGLPQGHPESYAEVVRRTVTEPLKMDPARVHAPNGFAPDLAIAGAKYEGLIKAAGGIDIQILGVGSNGHIGFNEPMSSLASRTHKVRLTPRTRADNARFFEGVDQVPEYALTQGLGTILDAQEAIMVVQGKGKAEAVAAFIEGPVSARMPASVLQLHKDVTIVLDEDAASLLEFTDYYRHTYNCRESMAQFEEN